MEMYKKSLAATALLSLSSLTLTGCGGNTAASPVWETFYSSSDTEERIEWINTLNQDSFGDLIATGETIRAGADRLQNAFVVKHDTSGNLLWKSEFDINDGSFDTDENITDSAVDNDGNIYIVGNLYQREGAPHPYSEFLLKVNRFGEQVWATTFSDADKTWDVEVSNGLIYVAGDATRVFDLDGNLQLEINLDDEPTWDVEADSLGNIYSSGHAYVAKHDSLGNLLWKVANPSEVGHATDMAINHYDEVYVAHHSYNDDRYRIVKISSDGNIVWERFVNDPTSSAGTFDAFPIISLDSSQQPVFIASNDAGRRLVKFSENGDTLWSKTSSGGVVRSLSIDSSDNVYIFGHGTGEKFDRNGSSIGTIAVSGASTSTTGAAIVSGSSIYVATSVSKDGSFTGYLAEFANQ